MKERLRQELIKLAMMLVLLPTLLVGCSNKLPLSGNNSQTIPPLSVLARQPVTPEYCLPTCSANLSKETYSWQSMLTGPQKQAEPANGSTIH